MPSGDNRLWTSTREPSVGEMAYAPNQWKSALNRITIPASPVKSQKGWGSLLPTRSIPRRVVRIAEIARPGDFSVVVDMTVLLAPWRGSGVVSCTDDDQPDGSSPLWGGARSERARVSCVAARSVSSHLFVSALRASKFGPLLACSTMPTDTETLRDSVELIIGIETKAEDASSNISDAPPFSPPKSRARRSGLSPRDFRGTSPSESSATSGIPSLRTKEMA